MLAEELALVLQPLEAAFDSTGALRDFLEDLGWDFDMVPAAIDSLRTPVEDVFGLVSNPDGIDAVDVARVITSVRSVFQTISHLGFAAELAADFKNEFPRQLVDYLVVEYLLNNQPRCGYLLMALGIVSVEERPAAGLRPAYRFRGFAWEQLPQLLHDPLSLFKSVYHWGQSDFNGDRLIESLACTLDAWGLQIRAGLLDAPTVTKLNTGALQTDATTDTVLRLILLEHAMDPALLNAGVGLFLLPETAAAKPGFALLPFATAGLEEEIALSDELSLSVHGNLDLTGSAGIFIWPDRDVEFLLGLASGTPSPASGTLAIVLRLMSAGAPFTPIGNPGASRFELVGVSTTMGTRLSSSGKLDVFAEFALEHGMIVIKPDPEELDGFLRSLLPGDGIELETSITIGASIKRGIYFSGTGGQPIQSALVAGADLDVMLPVNLSLGTVTVPSMHLGLIASDAGLVGEVSVSLSVMLGPVSALIDRLGLIAELNFPRSGDKLGPVDVAFRVQPPSSIGLSVDVQGMLTGGGFLRFDPQQEEYSGMLQLEIAETIAVKAIGLLTTRMPDGGKGYSLVVIIVAEGFAPIQLGFGFTLTGIGGLLGINRTVMVDMLRSGLKNGTLGSILFPADPIRNSPQIVSDLRTVFPPARDRYVFGPMAIIAWGTPTILTLEIALLLELPEPVRLIILGRLQAVLPDADHALIQVKMDAIGVIDFNKEEVSLDATLYDSRILEFVLTGDMALRANWGRQANFVLAIGGFNPRFPAPAGFPQLARLALSLGDSDNPRLRFEAYLALTSNTVQFGSRLDFSYSASGFTLAGFLGFDALFQFTPFVFIADVGAMVALKRGSSVLMGLFLDMTLAGPNPWHVWGKATFKVLFFKVSIHFDHRFGHEAPPALPDPIDVLSLLADALGDRRNWSSALPRGEPAIVSLLDSTTPATLRVHPLTQLTVRQRLVPLNRPLTKFGNAPLAGGTTTFTIVASDTNNAQLLMPSTLLQDAFAPAQFQEMSDDEKLTRPAFETQDAGLQFGVDEAAYQYEALPDTAITYETLIIDPTRPAETVTDTKPYVLPQTVLDAVVSFGAAGQASFRRRGSSRYRALEQAG
jgi:hypothetical protein